MNEWLIIYQVSGATKECNDSINQADTETAKMEEDKAKFQAELNDLSSTVKQKRDELKKFENQIDKKTVGKLYKILDKKAPEALSKMCESMVALLRGQKSASSSDVEMYLKNYDGLMYKMQRVDPAEVPEDSVKLNEKKLEELTKGFTEQDQPDFNVNSDYVHLFAWASNFCSVCKLCRSQRFLEKKLEEMAKRKVFLAKQKVRYQACLEDLELFDLEAITEEKNLLDAYFKTINEDANQRQEEIQ